MPPIVLQEDEPLVGLPFAKAASAAVIGERDMIARRLAAAEERAAWDRPKTLRAALAA